MLPNTLDLHPEDNDGNHSSWGLFYTQRTHAFVKRYYSFLYVFMYVCMYLFIYRERGREGEREGEKHQCEKDINLTSRIHPDQRQNLQPRHVP